MNGQQRTVPMALRRLVRSPGAACTLGLVLVGLMASSGAARAESIEFCGGLYRYIDLEFMRPRASQGCLGVRWPRADEALGWTWSETPPDANVEWIVEHATICQGLGPSTDRVVSRGRKVPRYRVTGKPYEFGNYVTDVGTARTEACQSVEYTPPPTARRPSAEAIDQHAPLVFGPVREGPVEMVPRGAIVKVARKNMHLYGVVEEPRQREAVRQLLANRHARCQEVDLGGYQCLMDGEDLSLLLASRGLVRPHSSATLRIRRAAESASAAPPATPPVVARPGTPATALQRRCRQLADTVERDRRLAQRHARYEQRVADAEAAYRETCGREAP